MEPARGGQAGREEKGKENEQDKTKNKLKEVHREVGNGKNTRGQDKTEGWEIGRGPKRKRVRRRKAGGGEGGEGGGRGEGADGGEGAGECVGEGERGCGGRETGGAGGGRQIRVEVCMKRNKPSKRPRPLASADLLDLL